MQGPAPGVQDVGWYHTIELPGGIVTPGRYDTRAALARLPFPPTLEGQRCLDVGTYDGFWAFEMERRNAAEIVAIDVADASLWDWPANASDGWRGRFEAAVGGYRAFDVAHRALGSTIERRECSVYDLSPESVGTFDYAFIGSTLLHLRDPVGALSSVRSVVRGTLLCADQISLALSVLQPRSAAANLSGQDQPHWWTPNYLALRRLVSAAGFEVIRHGGPYFLRLGAGAADDRRGTRPWLHRRIGIPHAWVLAR
jgi:tRNA (mo5U34)-methyltransferase